MSYLLAGYIQREARILLFNPGAASRDFYSGTRYVLSRAPEFMEHLPSGKIPHDLQPLLNDARILWFMDQPEVIKAAGGMASFSYFITSVKDCQIKDDAEPYHHHELVITEHNGGCIRTCWHHDNVIRKGKAHQQQADKIMLDNRRVWIVNSILTDLRLPDGHFLNPSDLFTWSVMHRISDQLPEFIHMYILCEKEDRGDAWQITEHSIVQRERTFQQCVQDRIEQIKPVVKVTVDPEPPASFFKIPKLKRWESTKYLQWVKSQPCCVCSQQADDPHHIIGHGTGGTGTKTHDLFTIPLCRVHHDELHRDLNAWEAEHGSQLDLLFRFLNRTLGIGAFG
ncbi:MAG TPA: cytoplasmic protein [Morganella sp. (in: Bacteria)]|nr:cytoplasmic protein [Morganella sp. (in: enterobacteria)]